MEVLKFFRKKHNIIALILTLITVISLYQNNVGIIASTDQTTDNENPKAIVMFHQGKNQFFNSTTMKGALDLLINQNFSIRFSSEPLNRTSLIGIDILIISGSPEAPSGQESNYRYSDLEISFINDWTLQPGHGLILISNPFTSNDTLDINNNNLNQIINRLDAYPANRFSAGVNGEGLLLQKLEKDNYDDKSILTIPLSNTTQFSFSKGSKIITKSNNVVVLYPMAKSGLDTFGVSSDGILDLQAENPAILGGTTSTLTTSRLFLMGSALMFSDLPGPDSTNTTSVSWLNTANNADVWIDSIQWTLNEKLEDLPQGDLNFMFLLVTIQVAIGAILIFAGFILFVRNKDVIPQVTVTPAIKRESREPVKETTTADTQKQNGKSKKQIKSSRRKKKRR